MQQEENRQEEKRITGYPSIDKPWLKYYDSNEGQYVSDCSLYQNVYKHNKDYLSDIAIVYYGEKITYETLFKDTEVCAKALLEYGVKADDCITMCTAVTPEAACLVLACSKIGATANFINPFFNREQLVDRINDTDAKLLFVMDKMWPCVKEVVCDTTLEYIVIISTAGVIKRIGSIVTFTKHKFLQNIISWKAFLKRGLNFSGQTEIEYKKNRGCIMVYSSGTTGASKGILLTNDGVNATISHYCNQDFKYCREDTFYSLIPIWFSTGIVLSLMMPLCLGVTVIPETDFRKEKVIAGLKRYTPTMTLMATSLWLEVAHASSMKDVDLSNMKYPITGGEKVNVQDENEITFFLKEHGCKVPLIKGYGMCELGSTITSTSVAHSKEGTAGYPIKGTTVAAFDVVTNKEQKYGVRGEIRVDTPTRMECYYKNPEETKNFFYEDEKHTIWGRTGDIGYVDEEGFVFVEGRATDSYETAEGKRVYLFDIEEVILSNDSIAQCKAVELEVAGEKRTVVHMVIRQSKNMDTKQLLKIIDNLCKEKLPREEVPIAYKIRDSLPVHPNGKRNVEALKADKQGLLDKNGDELIINHV